MGGCRLIETPRDRDGRFEPVLIPKHARRFTAFDDKQLVAGFSGSPNLPESRREAGFQLLSPDRVKADFLEGRNGWKPSWASDSHTIGSRIVRTIGLAAPVHRQPWASAEAGFVQDLQLHSATALSGVSVEGAADRQGWRRS